jgi:CubicO group peptidase (beta-lactamase class C family)
LRRTGDASLGQVLRDEIAGPLGLDLHIGVPSTDLARCAEVEPGGPGWPQEALGEPGSLWERALGNPAGLLDPVTLNGRGWRTHEFPAVNAHATARGLAALYATLLADDGRVLPHGLLAEALAPQAVGMDLLLRDEAIWTLGFRRDGSFIGMGGVGGSSAGMDPERGYAMAYVTRHLAGHDRGNACYDALEACLS